MEEHVDNAKIDREMDTDTSQRVNDRRIMLAEIT